jgi:protein-S-isoprenylcysteine O-methyltransferase Ste14
MTAIALSAFFGLGWIPLFAFRAEALQDALPYYAGRERFWVRTAPLIVGAHVALSCALVSFVAPLPPLRTALAIALYLGAVAFWFRARAQIGPLGRRPLPDEAPPALRRDGPFGLVRNPLYLAYLLAAAAPAIVAGRAVLLLTWLAAFAALAIRAAQEEHRLHVQLGAAYAAYSRDVKRLIPFLW